MEDTHMQGLIRRAAVIAVFMVGLCTYTAAAQQVVVQMRSGERLDGRFDGMENGQVYLVTRRGDREVPLEQIAMIDLSGDTRGMRNDERAQARGRGDLAVMMDGGTITGRVVRMVADNQDRSDRATVVFRTENGYDRRIPLRDVQRIYFDNDGRGNGENYGGTYGSRDWSGSSQSRSDSNWQNRSRRGGREVVVTVPGTSQWVDSGITVQQGQPLTITATGEITLSDNKNDKANPNGSVNARHAAKAPLPQTLAGALIGRIENGRPFGIGAGPANIDAPGTGRLYFGINDDFMDDNVGQYEVHVSGVEAGRQYSDSGDDGRTPSRRP
jgi:hypothetical protein